MSKEFANIKNKSIKKNDIVRIRFKSLDEILTYFKQDNEIRVSEIIEYLDIDYHLTSITNGGVFFVKDVFIKDGDLELMQNKREKNKKDYSRPHEISIIDHNSDNDLFRINENMIDEIEIYDDCSDTFFSDEFQLSIVRLDGVLIINGRAVSIQKDKKLIDILERTISDLSIRSVFESFSDEQKKGE